MLLPVAAFISTFKGSPAPFPVFVVTFNRTPLLKEIEDEVWAKLVAKWQDQQDESQPHPY